MPRSPAAREMRGQQRCSDVAVGVRVCHHNSHCFLRLIIRDSCSEKLQVCASAGEMKATDAGRKGGVKQTPLAPARATEGSGVRAVWGGCKPLVLRVDKEADGCDGLARLRLIKGASNLEKSRRTSGHAAGHEQKGE